MPATQPAAAVTRAFPLLPLILFGAVTAIVVSGGMAPLDTWIQGSVPAMRPPAGTWIWGPAALFGSLGLSTVLMLAIAAVLQRYNRGLAIALLAAWCAGNLIEFYLKHTLAHPSPHAFQGLLRFEPPEEGLERWVLRRMGMPMVHGEPANSYPSGHMLRTALLLVGLTAIAPRPWVKGAAIAAGLAMAFVLLGTHVHWASDVIGGAILAWALVALAAVAAPELAKRRPAAFRERRTKLLREGEPGSLP